MLWAISCIDKPDTAAIREKHLEAHRAHLQNWSFINSTVISPSMLENLVFNNWRLRHERHSAV